VCPVGAIYEYDQRAQIWESLYNRERLTIAQVSPAFVSMLNKEFSGIDEHMEGFGHKNLSAPLTAGKVIAAIKRLCFDMVFDEDIAINAHKSEQIIELKKRIERGGHSKANKLPAITGCSEGVNRFLHNFYPDLVDHLLPSKSPSKLFADEIKKSYAAEEGAELDKITTVSFVPCIAQKYRMSKRAASEYKDDYTLSAKELVRMIIFAGIDIDSLEEEIFNTYNVELPKLESSHVYTCAEKPEIVHGFSQAYKVMESIRKGECNAKWIEIHGCLNECC
jgi:NADP-reducing hydrogenase subunit HndD